MSFAEFGYRPEPKNQEKLEAQLAGANFILDQTEPLLVPPSQEAPAILAMSVEDLKKKFTRRYEMYIKLLRELKRPDPELNPQTITVEEVDEMKKWLIALNSLDTYIQNHHEGNEQVLRGRQITVFEDLRNFLEAGGMDGYVKLPTGFGKTVLFVELIEALNLRTLIAVPTTQLIDQTEESFQDFAEDLEVGVIYQKAKEYGRQVTIITYQSLIAKVKSGEINPGDFDCLILDETHKALGPETMKTVQKFEKAVKLGFTATPDYSEEKGVSALLETEIHHMTIREGVENNHLCSFRNILIRTGADISKVKVKGAELDDQELSKAVNIKSRNEIALKIYKARFEGKWAVGYCVDINHATAVAQMFQEAGVPAEAVHGKMNHKQRKEIFDRYKSGETKILFNADLLIAGFNEPRAEACFNLRPIRSAVNAEQRGGRVLRRDKNKPKKMAYIFDFIDEGADQSGIVTFAKVADGSFVLNTDSDWGKSDNGGQDVGPGEAPIHFDIEGVDAVYNEEEILRIQQKFDAPGEEKNGRTEKSALVELKQAYDKWRVLPELERGKFNGYWLTKNGYSGLYVWATNNGGINSLISLSTLEIKNAFSIQEKKVYVFDSAVHDLGEAYLEWKKVYQSTQEKFNKNWLQKNGWGPIVMWAKQKGGLEILVRRSSKDLRTDFDKGKTSDEYTLDLAKRLFADGYKKWRTDGDGKDFTALWLENNGYSVLVSWVRKNDGFDIFLKNVPAVMQLSFVKNERTRRDHQAAVRELREAYDVWVNNGAGHLFGSKWLTKNGYKGLYLWFNRYGNLDSEIELLKKAA